MKKLFSSQEIKFILIFGLIFIGTVLILTVFGLIPSEFKVDGGQTLEQKTQSAVREILEGKPQEGVNVQNNNTSKNDSKADVPVQSTSESTSRNAATQTNENSSSKLGSEIIYAENPLRIVIPSIGVDSLILNPTSAKHEILDTELTKGVVRYPGSGLPGSGNMFLFGHSTGFSVVQNKAFKVFNNLQNVKSGDTITIHGNEGIYTYTVKTVKKVDKENALVKFDTQNNMITLSTCDSFGKASDRYVVEGDLVSVVKK
ncbi:MAG: hypothetical protein RIQ72_300 [Candidatus Parcubacteria bacterium]|jgi:LPXTG-site transpeptidase (sortase) family protein